MRKTYKKQHPIDQLQRVYIYAKKRSLKSQILDRSDPTLLDTKFDKLSESKEVSL